MSWFPVVAAVLAVGLMAHEAYSISWKPRIALGAYERRRPGEFAKDGKQYQISASEDPREFRFLPPAPESPGLIRFVSPHHANLYVDGRKVARVYSGDRAGCRIVRIDGATFTLAGCPV